MLDKFSVAERLREIGSWLKFHGDRSFRRRAYQRAALAVEAIRDLERLVREERLTEVPGIGPAIARAVTELCETGRCTQLERASRGMPSGLVELLAVPHLTPRKILALHEALGISSRADLERACERGLLDRVKGFGPKTVARIEAGLRSELQRAKQIVLPAAMLAGDELLAHIVRSPLTLEAALAGTLRRLHETVGEIGLVAASEDPTGAAEHASLFPKIARVESLSGGTLQAVLAGGLPLRVVAVPVADYPATLLRETGSVRHVAKLAQLARGRGWSQLRGEAQIYESLGMAFIPPELREDAGEVEAALAGDRFDDLISEPDIRGMVHCHTTYSDGRNTIEEMARAAEARGCAYLTITDHSPAAHYAGGLEIDRLKRQWDEIDRVQERVKIRLLRGTESDILADGALDYPDGILDRLDVIIASVHARLKLDAAQMTARLVSAMRHPKFKIWGHALGRILLRRAPFACDVLRVLDAAAQSRAAIEINGDPWRVDLPPEYIPAARARGLQFVISTDAHSIRDFDHLRFGVAAARRGGIRRREVLNVLPVDEFEKAVRP